MSKLNELKTLRSSTNRSEKEQEQGENNLEMEMGGEETLKKSSDSGNVTKNSFNKQRESITNNTNKNMNNMNNMNMSSHSITGGNKNKASTRIEIDAHQLDTEENQLVNQISPMADPGKSNHNDKEPASDKKIFMTDYKLVNFDNKELFTFHDMIIPGGKNAKLCMVNDPKDKNLRVTEIADHFKFYEPTPSIVLIGANTQRKGKLFAGLTRAALNTRAVIIDSGLQTGAEKFCIRRNINLIGVAPESMIEYPIHPRPNPEKISNSMLTSGHSHFLILNNLKTWGEEHKFKLSLAERIANGRKGFPYKSKVVGVILGNIPNCEEEICYFIDKNWPLILIEDSELSQLIKSVRNGEEIPEEIKSNKNESVGNQANQANQSNQSSQNPFKMALINKIAKYSKVIEIEDDSENLASAVHLCLTISF